MISGPVAGGCRSGPLPLSPGGTRWALVRSCWRPGLGPGRGRRPLSAGGGRDPRRPGQDPLRLLAPRAAEGFNLLRHRAEALEVYLYDYHGEETGAQTDLLMPAGAGRFAHPGTETPVMYWGGDLHPGLPMPGDEPLAVLLATGTRARFVDSHPLDALIEGLTPIEADFLTATGFGEDGAPAEPSGDLLDHMVVERRY